MASFLIAFCYLACPLSNVSAQTDEVWTRQAFLGEFANDAEVNRMVRAVVTKPTYADALNEIEALEKMRSPKTRAALLRIAYGEIGQQYAKYGASAYASVIEGQWQARALLVSFDLEIVTEGFRRLIGQPLDEELFARAAVALTNDSLDLRRSITGVFQADTNSALAARKVVLIVQSMKTTLDCRDADRAEPSRDNFYYDSFTAGEASLWIQAVHLGGVRGVTTQMIQDALGSERGVVRDFATIAMAHASTPARHVPLGTLAERKEALAIFAAADTSFFSGDVAVRSELHGVLTNSPNVTARVAALSFLSWRPQPIDEAALKWVASNDTYRAKPTPRYYRMPGVDSSLESKLDAEIHPLRIEAEKILKLLRRAAR